MLTTCSCAQKAQLEYIFKDNMVREVGKCKVHEVFQREKKIRVLSLGEPHLENATSLKADRNVGGIDLYIEEFGLT